VDLNSRFARWNFKTTTTARLRLWRKLARLLSNGVPILRALQELRDRRVQSNGVNHPESIALRWWIDRISNGGSLAEAIDGWVTADEQMLIGAGEQQGDMTMAFERLELILTSRSQVLKAVVAGVSYPIILLVLVFGLLIFYSWKIIPVYAEVATAKGGVFTGFAGSLIWLSSAVRHWVWLWILVVVAAIVVFLISLPRWDGNVRVRLDRYAPYSIYRVMRGTAWLLSLAALVGVGRRVEDALLTLQRYHTGRWAHRRSERTITGIRRGLSLGAALVNTRTEFPDREVIADLLVYSKLNGVEEAINILAEEMLQTSVERIQSQSAVMRNVGFLAVAAVLGWTSGGLVAMNIQMGKFLSGEGGQATYQLNSNIP
jgi:type II secretory pathway component PulF